MSLGNSLDDASLRVRRVSGALDAIASIATVHETVERREMQGVSITSFSYMLDLMREELERAEQQIEGAYPIFKRGEER